MLVAWLLDITTSLHDLLELIDEIRE